MSKSSHSSNVSDSSDTDDSDDWAPDSAQEKTAAKNGSQNPNNLKFVNNQNFEPPSESSRPKIARKGQVLKAYRSLLHDVIQDATGEYAEAETVLPGSQIGATFWSSTEKELFFKTLSSVGPRNLAVLAQAMGTKTILEILVYLRLLQDGLVETQRASASGRLAAESIIPAAFEISRECEEALEEVVDQIRKGADKKITLEGTARYGHHWLIDGNLAERFELEYERETRSEDVTNYYPQSDSEPLSAIDVHDEDSSDNSTAPPKASKHRSRPDKITSSNSTDEDVALCPVTRFFRPMTFLRLSDALFMNGPPESGNNWTDFASARNVTEGPAIVRSALEDLYTLTRSFTQRLVQASHFQAMTRVRATDSRNARMAEQIVKPDDVRVACDILNLPSNSSQYWATVARRIRVDVYSESKKYMTGRPTTKNGSKLTYDEVEKELGLSLDKDEDELSDVSSVPSFSSDQWTEESFEDFDSFNEKDRSRSRNTSTKLAASAKEGKKRKRALSPRSQIRVETEHLEQLDQHASLKAERQIWKDVLGRSVSPVHDENTIDSSPKFKRLQESAFTEDWSRKTQYISEWQAHGNDLDPKEFRKVERRGDLCKKRRKLAMQHAHQGDNPSYIGQTSRESSSSSTSTDAPDGSGSEMYSSVGEGEES